MKEGWRMAIGLILFIVVLILALLAWDNGVELAVCGDISNIKVIFDMCGGIASIPLVTGPPILALSLFYLLSREAEEE